MRNDYATWDTMFMGLALAAARRSKDPKAQVGASVRGANNRVLSVGFNGPPKTVPDSLVPWTTPEKQDWIVHAEVNALLFAIAAEGSTELIGSTLYCSGRPCPGCARLIAHLEVSTVVIGEKPVDNWDLAQKILYCGGVQIREYQP